LTDFSFHLLAPFSIRCCFLHNDIPAGGIPELGPLGTQAALKCILEARMGLSGLTGGEARFVLPLLLLARLSTAKLSLSRPDLPRSLTFLRDPIHCSITSHDASNPYFDALASSTSAATAAVNASQNMTVTQMTAAQASYFQSSANDPMASLKTLSPLGHQSQLGGHAGGYAGGGVRREREEDRERYPSGAVLRARDQSDSRLSNLSLVSSFPHRPYLD
jgi:hypothetical protein